MTRSFNSPDPLRRGTRSPLRIAPRTPAVSSDSGEERGDRGAGVPKRREGGQYYGPHGITGMRGYPVPVRSNDASRDEAVARELWEVSEELTGVHYDLSAAG